MKAILIRYLRTNKETLGCLVINGHKFFVLEPTWKNNTRNVSCIPQGFYKVNYLARSASGKYRNCFHIMKVKNRTGILIHNGNTAKHTKGCFLLGLRVGKLAGQNAVLNSRSAMRKLNEITKRKQFELEVIDELVS
jgi:hypothetical protein